MTELSVWFIVVLLTWHYIIDALTQVGDLGARKDEAKVLGLHALVYFLGLVAFGAVANRGFGYEVSALWPWVNAVIHGTQDAITTRLSKPLFEAGNNYGGFAVVLGDQLLHHITLLLTWVCLV